MQSPQDHLIPPQERTRRELSTALYWIAGIAATIVLVAVITKSFARKGLTAPTDATPAGGKFNPGGSSQQQAPPRDDRPLALVELRQVDGLATAAVAAVETFEAACATWQQDVVPLLANDAGRRIASSADGTRAAMTVLDRKREPMASARTYRQDIDTLARPVRDALKTEAIYRPAAGVSAELEKARAKADSAAGAYRSGREELLALAAAHAASAPSTNTLAQAIEALRAGDALARAKAVGEAQAKAEVEARAAVAAAEKKRVDAEKDAELRRIATETSLAEKRAEFKRLRSVATDPGVQAQFQPFLQKGSRIPYRDYKGVMWRNAGGRTASPAGAIPYDVLAQARVFQTVEDMVAVGSSSGNDRSFWNSPAAKDEKAWEEHRKRFELLKEVAPIWHDMGLLGPPPEVPHLPDPDRLAPELTAPFQGEWSCPEYGGSIRFEGATGTVLKPSSANYRVGQTVYLIDEVSGKTLRARALFTGGSWLPVTAELVSENKLRFEGDGKQWHLEKNR